MKKTMCRYLRYLREPLVIGLIVTVLGVVVVAAGDGAWAAPGQSPLSQTVPPRPPPPPKPPAPPPEPPPPEPGPSQGDSDSSEADSYLPVEDIPLEVPGPDEPTGTDTPESGESSAAGSDTANATPDPSGVPASSEETLGDAGSHSVAVLQGDDSLPFRTPVSPSSRQGQQDSEVTAGEEKAEGRHEVRTWFSSFYLLPIGSLLFVVLGLYFLVKSRPKQT